MNRLKRLRRLLCGSGGIDSAGSGDPVYGSGGEWGSLEVGAWATLADDSGGSSDGANFGVVIAGVNRTFLPYQRPQPAMAATTMVRQRRRCDCCSKMEPQDQEL
ncbi:hypothetical protein LR48_Vigan08g056100 [Vigna angularis]|uniref:Uncharacterized protein n=1 Tax=Phaseolus angularis TaxID=3914 RepID=A0A0L9V4S4_PHAAN|nr:hypothetical protein LR48_Vigan08g056100 [Vigna angularis]